MRGLNVRSQGSITGPMASSEMKYSSEPSLGLNAHQISGPSSIIAEQKKHQGAGPWPQEPGTSLCSNQQQTLRRCDGPFMGPPGGTERGQGRRGLEKVVRAVSMGASGRPERPHLLPLALPHPYRQASICQRFFLLRKLCSATSPSTNKRRGKSV